MAVLFPLKTITSPQAVFPPPSSGRGQYAATNVSKLFSFSIVGAMVINLRGYKLLIEVSMCCPLRSSTFLIKSSD